jgi:nucleotide-binding universal stress UspA family protein
MGGMTQTALRDVTADAAPGATFRAVLVVVEFDRLVPGELSAASRSALRHAAAVGHLDGGRLAALHVLPRQPVAILSAGARDGEPRPSPAISQATSRLRDAIARERIPARVDSVIAAGIALDEIVGLASAMHADLIVAGYQDRPGAYSEGFSFRSLLHRAPCPVLVTRATDSLPAGWEP